MNDRQFSWTDFHDGSGYLQTKYNHQFYGYDKLTGEIEYPDGRYFSLSDNWKNKAEVHYMNEVLPKELEYNELLEIGIYAPYFNGFKFTKDLDKSKYVLIGEGCVVSKDLFLDVVSRMRTAEDKNFSDKTINYCEVAKRINTAFHKSHEKDFVFVIKYEGEEILIKRDNIISYNK